MGTIVSVLPNNALDSNGVTRSNPSFGGIAAHLSDLDTATFVVMAPEGGDQSFLELEFDSFSLASNQRARAARILPRISDVSTHIVDAKWYYQEPPAEDMQVQTLTGGPESIPGTPLFAGAWISTSPNGDEWTQAHIDAARVKTVLFNNSELAIYDFRLQFEILTRPTISGVSIPATPTRRPVVSWTYAGFGESQKGYRVKAFTEAQALEGGFDPDVTTPVYDSGILLGTTTSHQLASMLPDGTFRIYVSVSKDFNFTHWFSTWAYASHSISDPPPVPTEIQPVNDGFVSTDIPILSAVVTPANLEARQIVQWQLATDSGFTTNVRTAIEPTSALRTSGIANFQLPNDQQLNQGTWYLRARQVDEFSAAGAWTTPQQFLVGHPPSTINHTPTGGLVLSFGTGASANPTFAWDPSDPSPVDTQTAYQIIVERNDDGTVLHDTDKVESNAPLESTLLFDALLKGEILRWKVKIWDSDDVDGPWSDYHLFRLLDSPTITVAFPVHGGTVSSPSPPVDWSFFASDARIQVQRRVTFGASATPETALFDSGWLTTDDLTFQPIIPILENETDYWVRVEALDNVGLIGEDINYFRTAWVLPETPAGFEVFLSDYADKGYVGLTWSGSNRDGEFLQYSVVRRQVAPTIGDWELLHNEVNKLDEYEYHDWTARSGYEYEWGVTQTVFRFEDSVSSLQAERAGSPESSHYWLIHPTDESYNVCLRHATAENLSEEHEQETVHLIGRGRHTDFGDRLGFTGSVTAHIRDDEFAGLTAREQKIALENLKEQHTWVWFRNPFGDIFKATIGTIGWTAEPGLGQRQYGQATIPIEEVS